MSAPPPRWRRRSAARPAEIVEAALDVFAESGFAAARLETVAARAGVSKATLYLYFESKEALFRAAVRSAAAPLTAALASDSRGEGGEFEPFVATLLAGAGHALADRRVGALARMVIAESRNFPDLAAIWHSDVVAPALGRLTDRLAAAQARSEVVAGEPRLIAFSLIGPLLMGALYREVFAAVGDAPDLRALAAAHARFSQRALAPTQGD